jgi:tRNA(fMet)-specific endonuclease VapC
LIREGSLAISVIVYAEITEGLLSFDLSAPQVIAFSDFVSGVAVLGLSRITGDRFAQLRFDLRRSGQLIPDHDLWIAATAVELDAKLVSRDTHFDRLEILKRHR